MQPLEKIILSAIELGEKSGLSIEDTMKHLISTIEEKQNRYKWKKKILEVYNNSPSQKGCEFTMNFLEELEL
jgi:hypothetical protein